MADHADHDEPVGGLGFQHVTPPTFDALRAAAASGDHASVLGLSDAILAARPGDDAAHELRAQALLALDRLDEAEEHAQAAVRLDPDEIRYRELLGEVLSRRGAHREAAAEFGRLARNDPRQPAWLLAEANERLEGAQAAQSVEAARQAVRLRPSDGAAQLALSRALIRTGDARAALQAATLAAELLRGAAAAREALADARWLAGDPNAALNEYRSLVASAGAGDRERVVAKARRLASQRGSWPSRLLAAVPPLFSLALRAGWIHLAG